ncbi:MAG: SUMF1/EgtB/PvdO family nonheme iron enzyme [Myxococcota bacterium]
MGMVVARARGGGALLGAAALLGCGEPTADPPAVLARPAPPFFLSLEAEQALPFRRPTAPLAAQLASVPTTGGCPREMVRVGRFCIDRWEAHLVDELGHVVAHNQPVRAAVGRYAISEAGVKPQAHISKYEAQAACHASSKRLCAWIEWRRACQGPKWWRYPYGPGGKPGVCNNRKPYLLSARYGADPTGWTKQAFNDPAFNLTPGFLAPTGSHEGCRTQEGAFDMVGNLHEWVVDRVSHDFVEKMKREGMERRAQPAAIGGGIFMGGFYSTRAEHGQGCFFTTVAHGAKYYDYSVGFRCCRDADASRGDSSASSPGPAERGL